MFSAPLELLGGGDEPIHIMDGTLLRTLDLLHFEVFCNGPACHWQCCHDWAWSNLLMFNRCEQNKVTLALLTFPAILYAEGAQTSLIYSISINKSILYKNLVPLKSSLKPIVSRVYVLKYRLLNTAQFDCCFIVVY